MRASFLALIASAIAGCAYPDVGFAPSPGDASANDVEAKTDAATDVVDDVLDSSNIFDVEEPPVDTASESAPDGSVDTGPDVAPSPCDAGLALCGTTCVDTTRDRMHCGGCGKVCPAGQTCASSACNPGVSCRAIREKYPTEKSGTYFIDPDGAGPEKPFAVYCEMELDGGGWTLVAKMDGAKKTWAYDSAYWTNDAVFNTTSTDLTSNEAKFRAWSILPLKELRLGMLDGGVVRTMFFNLVRPSMKDLFSAGAVSTPAGRPKWFQLLGDPVLQAHCSAEGANQEYAAGIGLKMRLGIVGNNEPDCSSPDSYIGFGAQISDLWCFGSVDPGVVVGNVAPTACGAPKEKKTTTFGFMFVR